MKKRLILAILLSSQILGATSTILAQTSTGIQEMQVEQPSTTITLYRMYHPVRHVYLYTKNPEEYDGLVDKGWKREGVAWYSSSEKGDIVYRLYNPKTNTHLYTKLPHEYNTLPQKGWRKEGGAFRSYGDLPIYRLFNPKLQRHFYTRHMSEYKLLQQRGWLGEGVAFYGLSSDKPAVDPQAIAQAKQAVVDAQTRLDSLQKQKDQQTASVQEAANALQQVKDEQNLRLQELADKQAIAEEELADATEAAKKVIYQSEPGNLTERNNHPAMLQTIYAQEETEWVELSAQQQEQYQTTQTFTYQPDVTAIAHHIAAYISQIKELNGILGTVQVSSEAMQFATDRLAELKNYQMKEDTATSLRLQDYLATAQQFSQNPEEFLFAPTYHPDLFFGSRARSDKEMAYYFVLGWFTEYHHAYQTQETLEDRYRHALAVLDGSGQIGFSLSYPDQTSDLGFDPAQALLVRLETAEDSSTSTFSRFKVWVEGEKIALAYDGKRLQFPTKMIFQYGYTEETEDLVAARAKLAACQEESAVAKSNLQASVDTAQARLVEAQERLAQIEIDLQTAQTAFAAAQAALSELEAKG